MDNSKIDSNIKQILDLRTNKGVFPISSENAIIAHSPSGEMTYLDSVLDYLYLQISNKLRLYTEQDGNNARGKAYPATMGLRDSANINSLLNSINTLTALLTSLQLKVNNINPANDIAAINNIINQFQGEFNNLMEASEYTYLEIKFSNSNTLPPSNLEDSRYWKTGPISDPYNLWIGVREVTVKRGNDGRAIITKGVPTIVSLQGPKGDRGPQGPPGKSGNNGRDGDSYRPVFMYKWTDSRTLAPTTPTDPTNLGWAEDPGTPLGDNKYLWMTLNYQNINTNSYLGDWSTPVCLSGEDGDNTNLILMGPVVRFRGEYTPNTEYINSSLDENLSSTAIRYIDVVMIISDLTKTYYMVKPSTDPNNGTRRTLISPTASEQLDWEEAAGFSFIAAEALYAQNAHIDNLSGYEFVVQDGNEHIVAGMTGGDVEDSVVTTNSPNPVRIWAGSNATGDINLLSDAIPFKVFQDGKLKATDAEIKGDLSIDSLLLTGNEGSYYYNKSAITLPKIDDDNHKVIFIITAGNGTIVSASTGDVLFAFSNNNMQTTNSTTLSTYKIYLAISINNGQNSGWLLLNLNALELQASMGTISRNIIENLVVENGYWTIYSDVHNNLMKLYLRRDLGSIYSFTTINTSSYPSATNPVFSIQGNIDFETLDGDHLTTLHLYPMLPQGISNLGREELSGYVTMGSIIDTYNGHENDTPKKIYLDGTGWTIHVYSNPNDHTLDYIEMTMDLREGIDEATPIKAIPSISLTESFNYVATTNYSTPTTTSVVGSNGFVIKDGSIVATDMPEGASVNMKDCIVYKDVTGTATLEQYEVVNFGASNVTIGNTTLNPKDSVIIKALLNAHIDFSDVAAIDVNAIDIVDYVLHGDPVNH